MPEESLHDSTSHERYVDELVGANDYWLSITDAARVTRRQDVTIRRWIKGGQLPVRRHSVGLNQRTRQVRASDLAKLTPIIDSSATITSEEGRLSLTSIPVEQAALREGQQRLLQTQEQLDLQIQDVAFALSEQSMQSQQALEKLRTLLTSQLTTYQDATLLRQRDFERLCARQQQEISTLQTQVQEDSRRVEHLSHLSEQLKGNLSYQVLKQDEQQQVLAQQEAALASIRGDISDLRTELGAQRDRLSALEGSTHQLRVDFSQQQALLDALRNALVHQRNDYAQLQARQETLQRSSEQNYQTLLKQQQKQEQELATSLLEHAREIAQIRQETSHESTKLYEILELGRRKWEEQLAQTHQAFSRAIEDMQVKQARRDGTEAAFSLQLADLKARLEALEVGQEEAGT